MTLTQELVVTPADLKLQPTPYRTATADFEAGAVRSALAELFTPDAVVRLCHPFDALKGHDAFFATALEPLHDAMILFRTRPCCFGP
jgi:hypothetical protein